MSPDQDGEDRWLTAREVAERYRTGIPTVRYWRRMGTGPKGVLIGRHTLYRESACLAWERESEEDDRARRSAS